MTVVWAWVGRASPTGAWVRGQVSGSSVRLAVDTDPGLGSPTFYGPVAPDGTTDIVSIAADGLDPSTEYHWTLEVDTVLDGAWQGSFRTHPPLGEPATVRFWAGACAGSGSSDWITDRVSNHPAFDSVRAGGFHFGVHMGDLHYRDIGSGTHVSAPFDAAKYRTAVHDALTFNGTEGADARQGQLYRSTPLVYFWDDHDYGPNNADGSLPHKDQAALAYRQTVPHYTLPDGDGAIYQAFQVGRIIFACLDVRFHKSASTMLGAAQKTWLHDLLSSSNAAFLVLTMGSQWSRATGTHADSWAAYPDERQDLVDMFHDLGWSQRMLVLQGDNHAAGIDDGSNVPGGMPLFQFAPFDSNPASGSGPHRFNVARSGGLRGQWGSVEIADAGDSIEVTGTAFIEGGELFSYTFTTDPDAPPPTPPLPSLPLPEEVGQARIRTRMVWLGCDLVTGRVIAELHDITGPVTRLIGAHTSAQLTLPIPLDTTGRAPLATVLQATAPADTMIVTVVNDLPIWAGIPLPRERGTGATMPLGCVTIEGYLDRRYVGDHDFVQVDEALIMAALVGDAQVEGIGLTVDAPPTGRLRDRTYRGHDDATVYARLRELSQVTDGPEWTVDLDWVTSNQNAVAKILRIRPRLGVTAATPAAVFRTTAGSVFASRGGSQTSYRYIEDMTDGRYANHVIAVGSGEGEDRVQSTSARDAAALDAGRPRWEMRIRPSTSITDVAVLDEYAQAELGRRRHGALTWRIQARWDAWPRYGVDWRLGDDIAWDLVGHGHPAGVRGQGRAIGVEIDPQAGVLAPILLDPTSSGEG